MALLANIIYIKISITYKIVNEEEIVRDIVAFFDDDFVL